MNKFRSSLFVSGASAALAVAIAGPAFAGGGCDEGRHGPHDQTGRPDHGDGHHEGGGHGPIGLPGTLCLNFGGAHAQGAAVDSPGVLSGNNVQIPVDIPINVCGNDIDLGAGGNPGGGGGNGGGGNGGGGNN